MSEETLKLPSKDQISAAQELYNHEKMEYWRLEDEIMGKIKKHYPDITEKATTLVKVTLVNTFYSAGCPDVDAMTSWMVAEKPNLIERYEAIADCEEDKREVELISLVQRIARRVLEQAESDNNQQTSGNARVFASKFAHFFIDEKFPIFDQYAYMMVNFHLCKPNKSFSSNDAYATFYKRFFQLKRLLDQRDSVSYSTKQLDHYLRLSGMYITRQYWDFKYQLNLYKAAESLFKETDNSFLDQLFPPRILNDFPRDLLNELPKWKTAKKKKQKEEKEKKDNGK